MLFLLIWVIFSCFLTCLVIFLYWIWCVRHCRNFGFYHHPLKSVYFCSSWQLNWLDADSKLCVPCDGYYPESLLSSFSILPFAFLWVNGISQGIHNWGSTKDLGRYIQILRLPLLLWVFSLSSLLKYFGSSIFHSKMSQVSNTVTFSPSSCQCRLHLQRRSFRRRAIKYELYPG